jgi:hypothetical protein
MKTVRSWKLMVLMAVLAMVVAACGDSGGSETTTTEGGSDTTTAAVETTTTAETTEPAFDAEAYFKGRTIRVIVTHSEGGGSDLYARFIAARLGDYIPGNPRLTVTNEGGVGGIGAIYSAPEEDLVIGVSSKANTLYSTAVDPDAVHDLDKIRIIGGSGGDPRTATIFGDAVNAYPNITDATGSDAPILTFAETVGEPIDVVDDIYFFSWLCENLEMPCDGISVADDDSSDQDLMIQRGEMNYSSSSAVTAMRDFSERALNGEARIWFEYATDPNSEVIPPEGIEVPDIHDVLPADLLDGYDSILPMISAGGLGKHFWAGPALPDEVVAALRQAYSDLIADPSIASELGQVMSGASEETNYKFLITPLSGEEAQALFDDSSQTFLDNYPTYQANQTKYYELWK